jgi:glycosyltransferase involved in cell wall biosynthesis
LKVLHIINYLGRGGAEKLLVNILPVYKSLGHEVAVLQLSDAQAEPSYLKALTDQGIECLSLGTGSVYSPKHIASLIRFLRNRRFDVVHAHLFPSLYWTAIASKFIGYKPALVFTEHNTQNKRARRAYLRPIEKWMYSHFNRIVAITPKVKSFLEGRVCPVEQITVIRNGVDIDSFQNAETYPKSFWTKEFDLPPNAITLMMTARIQYPKDHRTLIDALKFLPSHFYLFIAGDGPDRAATERYADENHLHNNVFFLGFRNDIPRLMKSVDINILSSAYEGMSGVALEALAAGKPFLGSDVPGINDVVPTAEMLFPAGEAKVLSEKIALVSALNEAQHSALIATGLAHASRNSLMQMARNHVDLYTELLSYKR